MCTCRRKEGSLSVKSWDQEGTEESFLIPTIPRSASDIKKWLRNGIWKFKNQKTNFWLKKKSLSIIISTKLSTIGTQVGIKW